MTNIGNPLPLVSIIVPVYNVENYLEKCVSSLLAQTYQNIEVILIDDGSTDRSGALCDRLDSENEAVRVFHKKNKGPSAARNLGIHQASGEWVSFIDSDDFVSPIYIETLLDAATEFDCPLACVPGGTDFPDGDECMLVEVREAMPVPVSFLAEDFERAMLYQQVASGAQWRLYRRDILGEDPFPVDIVIGEDLACIYKFVYRAGRVALVNSRQLYAYRHHGESLIRQAFRPRKAESALRVSKQLYSDVSWMWPNLITAAASRCFSICRTVFAQIPISAGMTVEGSRYRYDLWRVIRQYRRAVLLDDGARRRERLAAAVACLGIWPFALFCKVCRSAGLMQ